MIKDIALIVLGVWAFFYMSDRMEPNTFRNATVFSVIAVVLRLAWAITCKNVGGLAAILTYRRTLPAQSTRPQSARTCWPRERLNHRGDRQS